MKAIIKRTLRAARGWLEESPDQRQRRILESERRRFDKFAYGELNVALLQIMRQAKEMVRPNYTWGVLQAAHLARALGIERISAIEFGVAGGHGLISLKRTAEEVQKALGIAVEVYGFDTGVGLPKPVDYRDLPNVYEESTYVMDESKLRSRLGGGMLILGVIEQTLPGFIDSRPAPVGFISVDVDLYSSTVQALKLLEAERSVLLPRIHCYFDDIMGFTCADFNGERLAIREWNESHELRKISQIYGLRHFVPCEMAENIWVEMMYMAHILDHDLYGHDDGMVLHKEEKL